MRVSITILFFGAATLLSGCSQLDVQSRQMPRQIQLTFDPRNHSLDNNDNFSPDDEWLVYDTRQNFPGHPMRAIGANTNIEKVNIETGEIVVVYETQNQTLYGPGVGAASYSPVENKIVCMHGLLNANSDQPYWFWRRTGVLVDEDNGGKVSFVDARDVTAPYTPGALRGGTHRHEYSGDGQWLGFTYNDQVMAEIEERTGEKVNLRTVGVSTGIRPVTVDKDAGGGNLDGQWFSVLVVKVVPNPKPGSDQVSKAFSDAWVGDRGYRKADGTLQRARAFLGHVRDKKGRQLTEVFVVDIPERIDIAGTDGPLEGTDTMMPMPSKGTRQQRLTYTEARKYPGVVAEPRHWIRSSSDGKWISYLARDDDGIIQVFFVSPLGGEPVQVTHHDSSVQSTVRWKPDGSAICYVCDNSIFVCYVRDGVNFGKARRMTPPAEDAPVHPCWSHSGDTIAFNREVPNGAKSYLQVFLLKL